MKWKVYCGYVDWFVTVEANTSAEAIELGRAEIIERITECDTFSAVPAGSAAQRRDEHGN